jgi:hypothetical protein
MVGPLPCPGRIPHNRRRRRGNAGEPQRQEGFSWRQAGPARAESNSSSGACRSVSVPANGSERIPPNMPFPSLSGRPKKI